MRFPALINKLMYIHKCYLPQGPTGTARMSAHAWISMESHACVTGWSSRPTIWGHMDK